MNASVFRFLAATALLVVFYATIDSTGAAVVPLQHFPPAPPMKIEHYDKEKQRLEARCPPLDPCKVGNYYMELFEFVRKGVNCPPQPQRCATNFTTIATSVIINNAAVNPTTTAAVNPTTTAAVNPTTTAAVNPTTTAAATTSTAADAVAATTSTAADAAASSDIAWVPALEYLPFMALFKIYMCPKLSNTVANQNTMKNLERILKTMDCSIPSSPTAPSEPSNVTVKPAAARVKGTRMGKVSDVPDNSTANIPKFNLPRLPLGLFEPLLIFFRNNATDVESDS